MLRLEVYIELERDVADSLRLQMAAERAETDLSKQTQTMRTAQLVLNNDATAAAWNATGMVASLITAELFVPEYTRGLEEHEVMPPSSTRASALAWPLTGIEPEGYLERVLEYAWSVPHQEGMLVQHRITSDSLIHGVRVHHCRFCLKIPMRGKVLVFRVATPPMDDRPAAWHLAQLVMAHHVALYNDLTSDLGGNLIMRMDTPSGFFHAHVKVEKGDQRVDPATQEYCINFFKDRLRADAVQQVDPRLWVRQHLEERVGVQKAMPHRGSTASFMGFTSRAMRTTTYRSAK